MKKEIIGMMSVVALLTCQAWAASVFLGDVNGRIGVTGTVADFTSAGVSEDLAGASVSAMTVDSTSQVSGGGITINFSPAFGGEWNLAGANNLLNDYFLLQQPATSNSVGTITGLDTILDADTDYFFYVFSQGNPNEESTIEYLGDSQDATSSQPYLKFSVSAATIATGTLDFYWEPIGGVEGGQEFGVINGFAFVEDRTTGLIQVDFGATGGFENGTTTEGGTTWNGIEPGASGGILSAGSTSHYTELVDSTGTNTAVDLALTWSNQSGLIFSMAWDLHDADRDGDYLGIKGNNAGVYNVATLSSLTAGQSYDVTVWTQAETDFRVNGGAVQVVMGTQQGGGVNGAASYTFKRVIPIDGKITIDWGHITTDRGTGAWASFTALSIVKSPPARTVIAFQ